MQEHYKKLERMYLSAPINKFYAGISINISNERAWAANPSLCPSPTWEGNAVGAKRVREMPLVPHERYSFPRGGKTQIGDVFTASAF